MSAEQVRPGYKLTEVGVIPEEWEVRRVWELGRVLTGGTPPTSNKDYWEGDIPWITPTDITGQKDLFVSERMITEKGLRTIHALPENTVLVTCIASIGKNAILRSRGGCNQQINAVIPAANVSPDFLYYLFEANPQALLSKAGATATSIVPKSVFEAIRLPLPPLPEQRAIAAALGDVDALLAGLERLIAKRRAVKQAAMDALLSGRVRLVESGEWTADSSALSSVHRPLSTVHYKLTEVGEIPEDWEVRRMEEIAYIDPETLRADTPTDYEFNYISIENVDKGTLIGYSEQVFRTAPSRARNRVKPGDVLFCTVRPNLQSHLLFDNGAGDWVCSTGFCVLRAKTEVCLSSFVFFQVFSSVITRQVNALIAGSNYPAINSRDLRKLVIPLPPLPEQRAIAEVLSDMDAAIAALERQRAKVQAIKQGMMQELLTGRIRLVK